MVAVIKTGQSISRILRYNEDKLKTGAARLLGEKNCPFRGAEVGLMPKLNYMERVASLNSRVTQKSVHISLNFARQEEKLSDWQLLEIATAYMEGIGFGKQPWLAYRHLDAGHPHLHLVSLKVRPDGSRIDMQNIGRNQSEATRKALEEKYSLIPAEKQGAVLPYRPEPLAVGRLLYGEGPTKKAIGSVLQYVLQKYSFTSLAELNAVLGLYNVSADRGKVTSKTFVSGGLLYRALDPFGNAVGVPQKASAFHFSPTLVKLETLFKKAEGASAKGQLHAKAAIDAAYHKGRPQNLLALKELLRPAGIDLILRTATTGQVYGVTFVDHTTHCVFNGSSLGKKYSAKGLADRCGEHLRDTAHGQQPSVGWGTAHLPGGDATLQGDLPQNKAFNGAVPDAIDSLLHPEGAAEYTASGFNNRKKQKKRKRRR
jgi:Relaxase/Mobilisation nuclease domain